MPSLNKAMIIGHLGSEPELKYTPSGTAVLSISCASSYKWKNKANGQDEQQTEWHRLVFWGKLAEVVTQYARKGDPIYVEGRLETRKWIDKKNVDHYTTEIIVSQMQLLGNRGNAKKDLSKPRTQPPKQEVPQQEIPSFEDFDDDIPF